MNYYDTKEIYDEFIKETVKLQFEIGNLDNEVEKPFENFTSYFTVIHMILIH